MNSVLINQQNNTKKKYHSKNMSRRQAAFGIIEAGSLVGERLRLVTDVWNRLCNVSKVENDSKVPFDILVKHYDANRHPLHVRGWTSRGRLHDLFVSSFKQVAFESEGKLYVAKDSFIDFYVKLSLEVQTMRQKGEAALDPDRFFCTMVEQTWHLDEDWGQQPDDEDEHGIANSNVEDILRPTGIKALEPVQRMPTDALDLVWKDPQTGKLTGFKGIVKPLFPRKDIPARIRGHFVLGIESAENKVKFIPTRPTNQPPFDFVWQDEETGKLIGLHGVVASSVDLPFTPDNIKRHLFTPKESLESGVEFISHAKDPASTLFKKINDEYGLDAVHEARKVAGLKKAVFEGTACGNVYATTWSGKFSDQFPGGPWRQAGLNCSSTAKKFY
jgi:hypothetical protein